MGVSVIDWTLDSIAMDIGKIRLNNRFFFPLVDVSQGHSSGRKLMSKNKIFSVLPCVSLLSDKLERKKIKFLLNDPYNWILTNAQLDHSLSLSGTSTTFV